LKIEKNTAEKKIKFFKNQTTIYLSLGLHKERPSYITSLQLSKEAIQHFKTWTFKKFSTFMGHFCFPGSENPDPDPLTRLNPDPDPQPWLMTLYTWVMMCEGVERLVLCLAGFPKLLVAAVNGLASGLGLALLPLCDLVYASDTATFTSLAAR
jgi:hypothetical protein